MVEITGKLSGVMEKYIPQLRDMDIRYNDPSQAESSRNDRRTIAGAIYMTNPDVDVSDLIDLWSRIPEDVSLRFRYDIARTISLHYATRDTRYHHLLGFATELSPSILESVDRDTLHEINRKLKELSGNIHDAWKNAEDGNRESIVQTNENFGGGIGPIYGYIELALL